MRAALFLALVGLSLAGCGGGEKTVVVPSPQASTTVVVPPNATVVCPSGRTAVLTEGSYRC